MSITSMELWTVTCDGCQRILQVDGIEQRLWETEDEAKEVMEDSGWMQAESGDVVCDSCLGKASAKAAR